MKNCTLNINGKILRHPENEAPQISVYDRGYLYGDSLYEVCRTYGGKLFGVAEHLERLWTSAQLMQMKISWTAEALTREMQRTLADWLTQNPGREAYVRIILSRGVGKIGFSHQAILSDTQLSIIVQELTPPTPAQLRQGFSMHIVERLRNAPQALDPAAKTGNYLNSLLAFLEAESRGADDALMLNADGHLTEGTTFNLFYVKRGIVVTPPKEIGILHGITRFHVLRLAQELGLETREVRFSVEKLLDADEVFLTSTIKEAFPITQVTYRKTIRQFPVGEVTLLLRKEFQKWAEKQV